jgi:hypothetical protein
MSPDDAHKALQRIISLVDDPNTVSDVPVYVRAGLKEGLAKIAADNLPANELASKLIGALRLIGDSCATDNNDVISRSIVHLYEALILDNCPK